VPAKAPTPSPLRCTACRRTASPTWHPHREGQERRQQRDELLRDLLQPHREPGLVVGVLAQEVLDGDLHQSIRRGRGPAPDDAADLDVGILGQAGIEHLPGQTERLDVLVVEDRLLPLRDWDAADSPYPLDEAERQPGPVGCLGQRVPAVAAQDHLRGQERKPVGVGRRAQLLDADTAFE
jgi:hypothetical protein